MTPKQQFVFEVSEAEYNQFYSGQEVKKDGLECIIITKSASNNKFEITLIEQPHTNIPYFEPPCPIEHSNNPLTNIYIDTQPNIKSQLTYALVCFIQSITRKYDLEQHFGTELSTLLSKRYSLLFEKVPYTSAMKIKDEFDNLDVNIYVIII